MGQRDINGHVDSALQRCVIFAKERNLLRWKTFDNAQKRKERRGEREKERN